jgi:hypothetical protein
MCNIGMIELNMSCMVVVTVVSCSIEEYHSFTIVSFTRSMSHNSSICSSD